MRACNCVPPERNITSHLTNRMGIHQHHHVESLPLPLLSFSSFVLPLLGFALFAFDLRPLSLHHHTLSRSRLFRRHLRRLPCRATRIPQSTNPRLLEFLDWFIAHTKDIPQSHRSDFSFVARPLVLSLVQRSPVRRRPNFSPDKAELSVPPRARLFLSAPS